MNTAPSAAEPAPELPAGLRQRVAWRLLPFLFLLYLVAFLDRVNLSYAAPGMAHDLGFTPKQLGFGMGVFFWGYLLLEIPGTLLVERWNARWTIGGMMAIWGVIAAGMGLVRTAAGFYWLRFLLGAAEAGFFPGLVVYLTHWFSERDRARALASMTLALPTAFIIGGPLSSFILNLHWLQTAGWRWLFVLEGIPAVLLGAASIFYLTDWPRQAGWLAPAEREVLERRLQHESSGLRSAWTWNNLLNPRVWWMVAIYFLAVTAAYGFVLWLPYMLAQIAHYSAWKRGWWATLPYLLSFGSLIVISWNSDRTGERRWHTAVPLFLGAAGLSLGVVGGASRSLILLSFVLVGFALYTFMPGFWALLSRYVGGISAAVAVGLINSLGNLGGYAGPYLVGTINTHTHSFGLGMGVLAGCLLAAGAMVLGLPARTKVIS